MYNRGTISEFDTWHSAAMQAEGITGDGKIGFINGVPAPQSQRTIVYSHAVQNPGGGDDYLWDYGSYPIEGKDTISVEQAMQFGWFPE